MILDWLLSYGDPHRYSAVPNFVPHTLAALIIATVEDMDEPQRSLIEMRYWERLTYREIGERMGWQSRGNAKHHVDRALKKLRNKLYDEYGDYIEDYFGRRPAGEDL